MKTQKMGGLDLHIRTDADESEVAEMVGREILERRMEPGVWALALAECGSENDEAVAMYARIRMQRLRRHKKVQHAKQDCLEARRLASCQSGDGSRVPARRTVQDLLRSPNRGKQLNFPCPKISWVWLTVLMLGTAGMVASFGRLASGVLPDVVQRLLPGMSLLAAILAVIAVFALRALLPKRLILLGWNTGMIAACNLVCMGSLFFGAKLVQQSVMRGELMVESSASSSGEQVVAEVQVIPAAMPRIASQP